MNNTICLNRKAIEALGGTIEIALLLLIINNKIDLQETINKALKEGYIGNIYDQGDLTGEYFISDKGIEFLNSSIIDSDKYVEPTDSLEPLARELKKIYPKGKKDGTNYYWAEGVALIIRRLKLFFKKYGDNYSHKQILTATKKYIESFNGQYQYMKLLKYFILKEKIGAAGDLESESELVNYIENAGQEDELKNDWTSTLK
jgi:hypothetical protein